MSENVANLITRFYPPNFDANIFAGFYLLMLILFFIEKKETLFRGNTLTTKLIDQYMKMVAIPYLQQTINDVIMKIMECKQSCEVGIESINPWRQACSFSLS